MIGIDVNNLDKVIKLNNMSSDVLETNIKKLLVSINELSECYSGKEIDFVFNRLMLQRNNINKILKLVKNYSSVLSDVKLSYKMQDENIKTIMSQQNHI